jgi:hypothetical protein
MGQFSWISKNGHAIRAEMHHGQKVWMAYLDENDKVQIVKEDEYEGYGVFGGLDYYEVLAKMNGKETRADGILEAFAAHPDINWVKFPQLYTVEPSPDQIHNWFVECEIDPNQGWMSNS